MKQNSSKKSSLNAPTRNGAKKTVGSSTKKTTSKATTSKKTTTKATSSKTVPKVAPKKTTSKTATKKAVPAKAKTTVKDKQIQKVYKNEKGKVIYRETTDKVGDVLVNGAGVKFKITSEKRVKTTGYDDGKLKIRVLEITPDKSTGIKKFETLDLNIKEYRDKKILRRVENEKKK